MCRIKYDRFPACRHTEDTAGPSSGPGTEWPPVAPGAGGVPEARGLPDPRAGARPVSRADYGTLVDLPEPGHMTFSSVFSGRLTVRCR